MKVPPFITPNTLTVTRILLIPTGVYTLFYDGGDNSTFQLISYAIFFTLGMTDIVDGRWARHSNRITPLGTFLDPVADKALIGAAMISLSILDRFPWWITILILTREIGITFFRLLVIKNGVIPASKGGKIKTLTQNFGVGFFILPLPAWLDWFKYGFISVAIILTITSAYDYLRSWYTKR
ncbi:CDP-diacylglycerol--glycerol-3-phosphate 3-phosphatidyltransferase [Actinobacteria bacterium IMCC25003]|nr:CDP-diacylglycerol--glycerol-3-phosphate 3-phosphatidyltransferase [Actinobacteria bacterium IMCC25003]